jgi:hypothetical protein
MNSARATTDIVTLPVEPGRFRSGFFEIKSDRGHYFVVISTT